MPFSGDSRKKAKKINPLPDSAAAAPAAATGKTAAGAKPAAGGADAPKAAAAAQQAGTAVTVSRLARALEPVSAGDGVDSKKVAAMREAIANGTYKVNADAIADKLLANAQEILSRVRR